MEVESMITSYARTFADGHSLAVLLPPMFCVSCLFAFAVLLFLIVCTDLRPLYLTFLGLTYYLESYGCITHCVLRKCTNCVPQPIFAFANWHDFERCYPCIVTVLVLHLVITPLRPTVVPLLAYAAPFIVFPSCLSWMLTTRIDALFYPPRPLL